MSPTPSRGCGTLRSSPCSRRHIQQLLLSFVAGILVTYAATTWLPGLQHPYQLSREALQLHTEAAARSCPAAPEFSLAPMALARMTGNHSATTDRLIVSTRHSEVCLLDAVVSWCPWPLTMQFALC